MRNKIVNFRIRYVIFMFDNRSLTLRITYFIICYLSLWRMTSGHSLSAVRICISALMILHIISSEVQFLVGLLSSTGCQCTTSAVLVSFNGSFFPALKNLVATICGQFCSFFMELFNLIFYTYSCKCIKPDCVFIHFLFNR